MLRTIDLFSGCGGMALGLRPWTRVVAYCEIEEAPRKTLRKNMLTGHLDSARVYHDVRDFPALRGTVDMVTMGFPCQDLSGVGPQRGFEGQRSRLFYEGMRVVHHHRPRFVMLENVPNICNLKGAWLPVLQSLHAAGYDARWCVVSAAECGAPHLRKRWFLLATRRGGDGGDVSNGGGSPVNPADVMESNWNVPGWTMRDNGWEADVPRMTRDMRPPCVARIRQCGNICVPRQAAMAFCILRDGLAGHELRPELFDAVQESKMPAWGQMFGEGGQMHVVRCARPTLPVPPPRNLRLVPRPDKSPHSIQQTTPSITKEIRRAMWSTPRAGTLTACRTLTMRSKQDIQTQMRFETNTVAPFECKVPNPEYLEWMVGLPRHWTSP